MNEKNDFALVPRAPTAVARAEPGTKRILAVIVADLLALAPAEDPESLYRKGCACLLDDGVSQNSADAAKWFRMAAEQGHVLAQCKLGRMYYKGDGVIMDGAEAVKWYRKAAEKGDGDAQFALGWMYFNGDGVTKDSVEGMKWYRLSDEAPRKDSG